MALFKKTYTSLNEPHPNTDEEEISDILFPLKETYGFLKEHTAKMQEKINADNESKLFVENELQNVLSNDQDIIRNLDSIVLNLAQTAAIISNLDYLTKILKKLYDNCTEENIKPAPPKQSAQVQANPVPVKTIPELELIEIETPVIIDSPDVASLSQSITAADASQIELKNKIITLEQSFDKLSEYASQINLLSLSASIEATKAGEAGAGFLESINNYNALSRSIQEEIATLKGSFNELSVQQSQHEEVLHTILFEKQNYENALEKAKEDFNRQYYKMLSDKSKTRENFENRKAMLEEEKAKIQAEADAAAALQDSVSESDEEINNEQKISISEEVREQIRPLITNIADQNILLKNLYSKCNNDRDNLKQNINDNISFINNLSDAIAKMNDTLDIKDYTYDELNNILLQIEPYLKDATE